MARHLVWFAMQRASGLHGSTRACVRVRGPKTRPQRGSRAPCSRPRGMYGPGGRGIFVVRPRGGKRPLGSWSGLWEEGQKGICWGHTIKRQQTTRKVVLALFQSLHCISKSHGLICLSLTDFFFRNHNFKNVDLSGPKGSA